MQQKVIDLKKIKKGHAEQQQTVSSVTTWPQQLRNAKSKISFANQTYAKPIRVVKTNASATGALRSAPTFFPNAKLAQTKNLPEAAKKEIAEPTQKIKTQNMSNTPMISETPFAPLLSWSAPEHQNEIPTADAKLWLGAGSLALLGYAVYAQNYLFAIIILLFGFVWYAYAHRPSRMIDFAVSVRGVTVQTRLYEFQDLQSFWIFFDPPRIKELSLESKKTLMPFLKIPLGETSPVKLRELLVKFIPEKKQEETLTEILSRRFGL
ncbi:hypothetical protein KGQ34_02080 [Patescibacteria group bacterium]|nr:hypothetical protein [Patescibacteria group bacterium]